MALLSLPDELLYRIAQELCDLHQNLDWRSSVVDTSRARLISLDFGLRSLHKVNKRLQSLVAPFYFRAVSVSTERHLAVAAKGWHGRDEYARWIRTLRISASPDSSDESYYAHLRLMFRESVNLTSLHVLHPTPADQRLFEAISQCKSLKHLWITCINEKSVDCFVPELRDLRLESASFCAHPRGAQLAERVPRAMKPVLPIQTLLSGSSRRTLRFLHFRRATERLFVHMNKTLSSPIQRLEHVIPDNVVFESLETLKIGGVTAQDFWLGDRAAFFPALRNLMTGIDPLLAVTSSQYVWPGLRCVAVHKLLARDRLVCSAPSLEEFSMFSPLTASELGTLIADLRTHLPSSRLTVLSLRLVVRPGIHLAPATVHDIDSLFSSVPNVERLTLMAMTDWGHFPWEMDRETYVVAFSKLPRLKKLHWNFFLCPLPDYYQILNASSPSNDEWFVRNTRRYASVSTQIAGVCTELIAIFWDVRYDRRGRSWRADVRRSLGSRQADSLTVTMDNSRFHYPNVRLDDSNDWQVMQIV